MTLMPRVPIDEWINASVQWLYNRIGPELGNVSDAMHSFLSTLTNGLMALPWWLVTLAFATLAFRAGKWRLSIGTVIGLFLIEDLGMWDPMIASLVLILVSAFVSVLIGFPIGVWCARQPLAYRIISPMLDIMQTMPSFVYLVPALMFFNIGPVPAVFATVVFSMPPVIRLTRLGILQVPEDLVEAATAFGASDWKLLWKVQVPLALPNLMAGINQTIMMALSMVVISSMIGAGGLGNNVVTALETVNIGQGFEAGFCIVILAILLDRISQQIGGTHHGK
ncbi:ABC transporter permease [Alicyclobacillus fructus]|uniref:ABC transporter permease n=1 Tax=Alicyclobacillus fructus TaxID=2816082 RepID=UPI001A8E7FE0|nr:proline/glycine betaine ABC transporter permease [Alicyclobacillus fructus]